MIKSRTDIINCGVVVGVGRWFCGSYVERVHSRRDPVYYKL